MVTPDYIPNSEVKHCSTDDTLLEGKVGSRQNLVLKISSDTLLEGELRRSARPFAFIFINAKGVQLL